MVEILRDLIKSNELPLLGGEVSYLDCKCIYINKQPLAEDKRNIVNKIQFGNFKEESSVKVVKANLLVGVMMMTMKWKRMSSALGLLLVSVLILSACSGWIDSEAEGPGGEPVSGEELDQEIIVELVKADLASWKGVAIDDIGAASIEAVEWPDTSLGCPQEGESYAQVLTPGYRILLAIGGPASVEQFDYRADTLGNFILCEG